MVIFKCYFSREHIAPSYEKSLYLIVSAILYDLYICINVLKFYMHINVSFYVYMKMRDF